MTDFEILGSASTAIAMIGQLVTRSSIFFRKGERRKTEEK
jgi:hypothetical protein